jgi:cell volume regulation protein A
VRHLVLPDGAVIALIARGQEVIPPHGGTRILAGDHVILVVRPGVKPLVDRVFAEEAEAWTEPVEFGLRASARVGELEDCYGVELGADRSWTLDELVRARLGRRPRLGDRVVLGPLELRVRAVDGAGVVERVGLVVRLAGGD